MSVTNPLVSHALVTGLCQSAIRWTLTRWSLVYIRDQSIGLSPVGHWLMSIPTKIETRGISALGKAHLCAPPYLSEPAMKGSSGKIGHMELLRCPLWEIGYIVSMKGPSGKIGHMVSMLHPSKILAGKQAADNPSGIEIFSYFSRHVKPKPIQRREALC